MLIPTSTVLLSEKDNVHKLELQTIKIDFSKMSFVPHSNSNFTRCANEDCSALLTSQDKRYICEENGNEFKGPVKWKCRFCREINSRNQVHFISEKLFKVKISDSVPSKIVPPIVLFLIDVSGSMTSTVLSIFEVNSFNGVQTNNLTPISSLSSKLKIILSESMMHKTMQNLENSSQKYCSEKYVSKLSFLFSIIEFHLKNLKGKKIKENYRIGFIFFSDSLMVMKGAKQKSIPTYIHVDQQHQPSYPLKYESVDFNSFQCLLQRGKSYDRYFGDSKIENFDVSKLALRHIKVGGRTAMGPALALAAGIVSEHDRGSKIIVVTDSRPNYGLLFSGKVSLDYKEIGSVLKENQTFLGFFQCYDNEHERGKDDIDLETFIKAHHEYVRKNEVAFASFLSKSQQTLNNIETALKNLIDQQPIGNSLKLSIQCDNSNIVLRKFKYDSLDFKKLRFITSQSRFWVEEIIEWRKLTEKDYLFPFNVQLVIEYDDIFKKERNLFMSEIQQRFIRKEVPVFKLSLNSEGHLQSGEEYLADSSDEMNMENINKYMNLENLQHLVDLKSMVEFEKIKENSEYQGRTVRKEVQEMFVKVSNTISLKVQECHSINDYVALSNRVNANDITEQPVSKVYTEQKEQNSFDALEKVHFQSELKKQVQSEQYFSKLQNPKFFKPPKQGSRFQGQNSNQQIEPEEEQIYQSL